MWRRIGIAGRAVVLGGASLYILALVERPCLILMARTLGSSWVPTVRLGLDCCALAATGWVIGRFGPAKSFLAVAAFAAILALPGLGEMVEIKIPWLFQLAGDALRDRSYWDSFFDTAISQAFLFSSLFVGARLSRRDPFVPPSILTRRF